MAGNNVWAQREGHQPLEPESSYVQVGSDGEPHTVKVYPAKILARTQPVSITARPNSPRRTFGRQT